MVQENKDETVQEESQRQGDRPRKPHRWHPLRKKYSQHLGSVVIIRNPHHPKSGWLEKMAKNEGSFAWRAPVIQINVPATIPMHYPGHTQLGVPFSQLQKRRSFMHDWMKWC